MCGRFQLTPPEEWIEEFGLVDAPTLPPRYNIAPTQPILAVRAGEDGRRQAGLLRWGLVPSWAPDPSVGNRLINARSESAATKPAFRDAFRERRCLIPATGFYEWRRVGRGKTPYLVRRTGGRVFALAGLWERWRGPEGPLESCAILTTPANALVAPIHSRMPVLLDAATYGAWLDAEARPADLEALLAPYPAAGMEAFPVSPRVNRPEEEGPRCAERVDAPAPPAQLTLF